MKKLLLILLAVILGTSVSVALAEVGRGRSGQIVQTRTIGGGASTTPARQINSKHTIYVESPFEEQGVCVAQKDLMGGSYTYKWTQDGQEFTSTNSCE